MVVSDRSTDGTDQLLTSLALETLVSLSSGTNARRQNRRTESPAGPGAEWIIILADANLRYGPDTVRRLVAPFADPDVGFFLRPGSDSVC